MLVLQKAYGVSKTALVPAVCPHDDELIEANSKLTLIAAISGAIGGGIGIVLIAIFSNGAAPVLASLVFLAGAVAAIQLPQVQIAAAPVDITEKLEVRGANIILAATTVAVLRGIVGFTTFLLAFHLRSGNNGADIDEPGSVLGATMGAARADEEFDYAEVVDLIATDGPPQWHFVVAGAAAGAGAFLGARYAPIVRARTTEERIVLGSMIGIAVTAFLGAWGGGITGTSMLAFGVGISAAMGKLGFDALVQRDAPRSNHGRTFAKFEGRFQLSWAIGAFIAVIIRFPIQFGALIVAIAAAFSAVSYELGRRTDRAQASSRVGEVIRERVPASKPIFDRLDAAPSPKEVLRQKLSRSKASDEEPLVLPPPPSSDAVPTTSDSADEQLDPTLVAAIPLDQNRPPEVQTGRADDVDHVSSGPVDQAEWSTPLGPQVVGDGVWVAPEDPPAKGPGEDGQYRLWE